MSAQIQILESTIFLNLLEARVSNKSPGSYSNWATNRTVVIENIPSQVAVFKSLK